MTGLLAGKTVVVFAATGAIASAVAKTAIAEGATVFASGHKAASVANLQRQLGDEARCSVVDATRPESVREHLEEVLVSTGTIDGVFNGIGGRPQALGYPEPVESMSLSQFMIPIERILGSTFVTSREAAFKMKENPDGGSMVTLSATLSVMTAARMANLSATCAAIEGLTRSLAGEFGADGIRVNCVRGSAMPETRTIQETVAEQASYSDVPQVTSPPLGRPITVQETANTAAFLLSDRSSGTTGQVLTVCAGQFV